MTRSCWTPRSPKMAWTVTPRESTTPRGQTVGGPRAQRYSATPPPATTHPPHTTRAWKRSIRRFVITEKAPTRAFFLLKVATTTGWTFSSCIPGPGSTTVLHIDIPLPGHIPLQWADIELYLLSVMTLTDALMENKVGARCGPVRSHALAASPLQFYTTTAANSYFDIHNNGVEVGCLTVLQKKS